MFRPFVKTSLRFFQAAEFIGGCGPEGVAPAAVVRRKAGDTPGAKLSGFAFGWRQERFKPSGFDRDVRTASEHLTPFKFGVSQSGTGSVASRNRTPPSV